MRRLVYLTALVCGCQQVSDLKQKYFAPETPWTHLQPAAGAVVDRMAGPCWIPTYSDDYYGFAVGQPTGWKLDFSTGTLMVVKDEKELEGVMIYPTRLRKATPPEDLAAFFAKGIGNLVRSGGGTFELVDKTTDGRVASGLMLATIDGVRLRGPLQVIASPGFATLKAYWAPETEMDKEEPTLKQIVSCFQRKMLVTAKAPVAPAGGPKTSVNMPARQIQHGGGGGGTVQPLQPYRGRFMALSMPAGWRIQDESQYGIDVTSGDKAMGVGFGWFMHPFKRADVMAMETINTYYPGVRILNAGWQPGPAGWQIAMAEFEGPNVHGVERVAIGQGVALTSGWTSGPKVWGSVHATLEAIAATVQIQQAAVAQVGADVRRQLASYPKPVSSAPSSSSGGSSTPDRRYLNDWARQDKESEQRSDAMLDQERAISPTTGETYVVPTNAWNPSGPDGAGYYRPTPGGGQERLEPKDPSAPAD